MPRNYRHIKEYETSLPQLTFSKMIKMAMTKKASSEPDSLTINTHLKSENILTTMNHTSKSYLKYFQMSAM